MNDVETWIFFDGPEPESLRPLLDALRDLPPAAPADREIMARRVLDAIDADLAPALAPPSTPTDHDGDAPTLKRPSAPGAPPPPPPPLAPVPVPPVPALPLLPPVARPPTNLAQTGPALDLPASARDPALALPFKPASPDAPRVPRTMKLPIWRGPGVETTPIGDDSIEKAVALLPFHGNTVGKGVVPFPRMDLRTYASLRAQLAVRPEKAGEILLSYHVLNEAARAALDEQWRQHFTAHPEERAVFEETLVGIIAYVRLLPK